MAAGESARLEARRARERAERLARRADLFEQGAEGESRTAEALQDLGAAWTVFHDNRWPGRRFANIDHIVVGPGGIFVVDSKNWSGNVRVVDRVLRQNGRSREKAVAAAADAALAVAELAAPYSDSVRPVLCFTRDEEISGWARDVMVCSTSNVVGMLESRPRVLTPDQVSDAALRLDVSLREAANASQTPAERAEAGAQRSKRSATSSAPRRGRRRRPARGSTGRLVAALVGALLFLAAIPTVLPLAASAISEAFVEQFLPSTDPDCPSSKAVAKQDADRSARDGSTSRRLSMGADCR